MTRPRHVEAPVSALRSARIGAVSTVETLARAAISSRNGPSTDPSATGGDGTFTDGTTAGPGLAVGSVILSATPYRTRHPVVANISTSV